MRQPVGPLADPLELLGLELNVGFRCAERRRLRPLFAEPREALRVEERAEPRLAIHLRALGVDRQAVGAVHEQQLAARVDRLCVPAHFLREELDVVALDLDGDAEEAGALLAIHFLRAGVRLPADLAVVERTGLALSADVAGPRESDGRAEEGKEPSDHLDTMHDDARRAGVPQNITRSRPGFRRRGRASPRRRRARRA